jgi:hypothetical protein
MQAKNTKSVPKPKQAGQNVRIEDEVYEKLKDFCDKNLLRMGAFVSKIIDDAITAKTQSHE